MKIAIAAATGNIGSRTAYKVAEVGAQPILLGRNSDKLEALKINNAISTATDISNAEVVTKATAGADALLWLVPPIANTASLKEWYEKIIAAGVAAVKANNIKRVVAITSVGAGSGDNLGTITYAGQIEEAFRQLKINFVALRPGYFMENFFSQTASIKEDSYFSFTYASDHDIPFISTDDIGDVAARYLLDDSWAGQWSRNLMGPKSITLTQAAATLSEVLNKPISYRQISLDEAKQELTNAGLPQTIKQELIDLFRALGDSNGIYATARTTEDFTPTTFKQFVRNKFMKVLSGS